MGGLDFAIAGIFLAGILCGVIRGILGTIFDVIAILCGLAAAAFVYRGPVNVFNKFNISGTGLEVFWFLLCWLALYFGFVSLLELIRRRRGEDRTVPDRAVGAALGCVTGVILASALVVLLSVSKQSAEELAEGRVATLFARHIPGFYTWADRKGLPVPKVILQSRTYEAELAGRTRVVLSGERFSKYEGATCLACGGKVRFDGYQPGLGGAIVPKFTCTKCGRTSCGCQTYEVFHALYGKCPIEVTRAPFDTTGRCLFFDCRRFPNDTWIVPRGPCPVDNAVLPPALWKPPIARTPSPSQR